MALPKSIDKLRSNLSLGNVPQVDNQTSVPLQRNHPDSIKTKVDEYIKDATGVGTSLVHPSDLPIYHMNMKIYKYSGTRRLYSGFFGSEGLEYTIKLPLALALDDNHGVKYAQDEIGAEFFKNTIVDAFKFAKPVGAMASVIAGVTPNKALAVMFQGPQYKKYTLTWILGARNEKESITIRKIISAINWGLSTDYSKYSLGTFFDYPSVFKMGFSYPIYEDESEVGVKRESDNSKWFNFKPAVCDTVSFKYLPQGHPVILNSGYPEAVSISCKFTEIEYWLKQDFRFHSTSTSPPPT